MVSEQVVPDRIELSDAVTALARIVLAHESFELVLERLTMITKQTVPGAYEVSVTIEGRDPVTVATTARFARLIDEYQYQAGFGPRLGALRSGTTVIVEDQATETRWPQYSLRATQAGVGSSVSVPLQIAGEHIAALNIYGGAPHSFTSGAVLAAEEFAVYAGVVLNNADIYYTATSLADQLADAMSSRAVIEQAKGVLMAGRRCDADAAFDILVKLSQHTHRKLRTVAQAIVDQISTDG